MRFRTWMWSRGGSGRNNWLLLPFNGKVETVHIGMHQRIDLWYVGGGGRWKEGEGEGRERGKNEEEEEELEVEKKERK